jgi:DNA/RNA endonuclease G (NUC1)
MMPSSHRTNSEKDNISSFLMTNVLPQHKDNNDLFQGEEPSSPAWTTFDATLQDIVTTEQKELYVVAGGYGSNPNRQQFSHNSRLDRLTNPQILTDKGINIPGWTWKVVLELDRLGLRFDDVTTNNASAYAILTPNEVEPVHEPRNPDGRAGNDGDFPVPVVHPFNALLGLTLPDIPNKAAWRNWETWQLSVNELETLTELDFFSNIPEPVEEAIEA